VAVILAAGWQKYRSPEARRRVNVPLMWLIGGFIGLAVVVTVLTQPPLKAALVGVKTDLEFLVLFAAAVILAGDRTLRWAVNIVLISGGIVIGVGLLQSFVLPADFLRHFGYGATTIAPYQLVDPALHSFRIISTLGGANQLGSYLILPLSLTLAAMVRRFSWWQAIYLLAGLVVMAHTYSRSAWLGLAAAMIIVVAIQLPSRLRLWFFGVLMALAAAGGSVILTHSLASNTLQYLVYHGSIQPTAAPDSTDLHVLALEDGINKVHHHPLGEGLGAAGPASYYGPSPFIPESGYLQLAIEVGIAGLLLMIAIQLLLGLRLWALAPASPVAAALLGTLVGIGIINFFLHGWADSSTAFIYWLLAGLAIGRRKESA
jgi:O-antigen ligase